MNNAEEKLWNYIDGTCTPQEQEAVAKLIASDESIRLKYQELLALNQEFETMELDEPPMAFTYNVMEAVRNEYAKVPLKTTINRRIIMGIALFFVLTLTAVLVYAALNISLPTGNAAVDVNIKVPDISAYISKPVIESFMFVDVVMALFLFDSWLRGRNSLKNELKSI